LLKSAAPGVEEIAVSYTILNKVELPGAPETGTAEFEGYLHGGGDFSFLWVEMKPGRGPKLHRHPYEETFIVLGGRPLFTVGAETLEAQPGQIIIVPADTPHKFLNIGEEPLRQIDIHASKRFITEWLED
jgi:mannose-6-phosphate isomerase-like protein (cupin superfamily)